MLFLMYYLVQQAKCQNYGHQNNLIDRPTKFRADYGFYSFTTSAECSTPTI